MAYRKGDRLVRFAPSFLPFVALFQMAMVLVRLNDWLVFRLRVKGREHLRRAGPLVLVSNHTLVVDPGVIAHVIHPRRTYFTMLEETALMPLLGTFVRLLGAVPIPESPASMRILEGELRGALRELGSVHFFPEGECYLWNQEIRPFHPGAFFLACRLSVPVAPITTVLHERRWFGRSCFRLCGRTLRLPPRVTVVVGRPLEPERFLARAGSAGSLRGAALAMSRHARQVMQAAIDREGGSKRLFRGQMARLGRQDQPAA